MTLRDTIRSGVERVLSAAPRRTAPGDRLILAYHNVVPSDASRHGDRSLHLPLDEFERQMQCLRDEADVVSLDTLLRASGSRSRLVAITFDDAYASALVLGVSACVSLGFPCTVFVAPALLGQFPHWDVAAERGAWSDHDRHRFLWEHRGLTKLEPVAPALSSATSSIMRIATESELLAACHQTGVSVGNHTMRHANLGALSSQHAQAELSEADAWLRDRFPATVPVVAYPYGIAPQDRKTVLSRTGLEYGLQVTGGWWRGGERRETSALPRWNVPAGVSSRGFRLRARGWLTG
jgi:peptidoglycan/xylan/chitin deacetylase (PgdA/CDA1 family)